MQNLLSKLSLKTPSTKALFASVIALLLCSNLALTAGFAKNGDIARRRAESDASVKMVDDLLTVATSRFAFKLYEA